MSAKRRNALLLLMCFLVYTISYIGKYSYSTNIQNVITDLQISKSYAGYVSSAFFFCYGAGQAINGFLCEKLNSKWTVSIALLVSAFITFLMFFLKNIIAMSILWGVNGLVLSVLWCHCIKLLATIRDEKYIVRSVTVMSATLPAGIVIAYGCSTLFTFFDVWKINYIFAAALLGAIAITFMFVVNLIERSEKKELLDTPKLAAEPKKIEGVSIFRLFGFSVIPLFIIGIMTGLIRDGSNTWLPVLLTDTYALPDFFSILLTLGLPLMGVFTAVLSTGLMKKTNNVLISLLICGGIGAVISLILVFTFQLSFVVLVILFMLLSICAYIMTNTLTSILPLYYKGRLRSGEAAGIVDAFVYLGSAIGMLIISEIVETWGWQAFMFFLLGCCGLATIMALLGTFLLKKKEKKQSKEISISDD